MTRAQHRGTPTQRVLQSLGSRAIVFPITALATFATTWIVLLRATPAEFAAITLIATLSALLAFSDLGLGAAIINLVASDMPRPTVLAGVGKVARVLVLPAGAIVVVAAMGVSLFSWTTVLGLAPSPDRAIDVVTAIVLGLFAVAIPLGIGQRILTGLQLNHLQTLVSASGSVVALLVTAALWATPTPPIWMAIAGPVGLLCGSAACTFIALRRLGATADGLRAPFPRGIPLMSTAPPMLLVMLGLPLALHSHRLILSHQSTAEELATYSLAMQFYVPAWSLISVSAMALWPIFAGRRGTALESDLGLFWRMLMLFVALGASLGIGAAILIPPLAALLSHGSITVPVDLSVAVACLLAAQAVQQVPGMFLTDTRGLWFQAACVAALASLVIPATWVLAPVLGAIAPVAVTAVGVLALQFIPGLVRVIIYSATQRRNS